MYIIYIWLFSLPINDDFLQERQVLKPRSALRFEAWHLVFGHALVDLRGGGDAEDTKCRGFNGMMMIIVINNDICIYII